jgi:hypothetical protein
MMYVIIYKSTAGAGAGADELVFLTVFEVAQLVGISTHPGWTLERYNKLISTRDSSYSQ